MGKTREVYYVSGNTGILAKNTGKALLAQFPEISFIEESFPFIRTKEEAQAVLEKILKQSPGRRPLVFSTLFIKKLNEIFDIPGVEFLNICDHFLVRLEDILETKALRVPGFSRHLDDLTVTKRVNAIQFTVSHDDGTGVKDYDQADLILVGVSRSGKTPVSVYFATQMGVKTANYPLVEEDLNGLRLPHEVVRNIQRVAGLTTSPQMLHIFRENRYKGSKYADLSTCAKEINQAKTIFQNYKIPIFFSDGRSIEETATQITQELQLNVATSF
jgi:[pyruvate, water dikinase]-phosphate phosphotransferase / [pyruvate, water dikinase] kinase